MIYSLTALISVKWVEVLPKSNSISWSSSTDTLSVELTFDSLTNLAEGTHIMLKLNGIETFTGLIVKKFDKKLSYSYICYDYAFYLNKNKAVIQFNKVTADVAIKQLCASFGVKCNVVKINYIVQDSVTSTVSTTTSSASSTSTSSVNNLIAIAKKYLGVKYVYGGTTPSGFDCSGFVQYCFKQIGINLTRTTYTQVKEGTYVAKSNLQAGDIVFFGTVSLPHHEALYIGSGNVIQAPHTGDVVKITALSAFGDYATARRIKFPATKATTSAVSVSSGTYAGNYANGLYKDWINTYARQYGLNPNLVAGVIEVESTFNCNAYNSRSGATGLGQFLLSTAREEGLANRKDPQSSIQHLCSYLAKRIKQAGSIQKGIMGYGEGTLSYYNKVVAATPGHNVSPTSGSTGTVSATQVTTESTITTYTNKIYKDKTLSSIIDDILANATLALGPIYIKEMIADTLYVRLQVEFKVFPTFLLNEDLVVNSSIEDMKNKVIATSSDETTTKILSTVTDPTNIKIYGGLQEVLSLEATDIAKAKTLATNYLKANNKIFRDTTLNIVVIGGGEKIRANRLIGLSIASKGINGWYNIKAVNNVLADGQYKSALTIEW